MRSVSILNDVIGPVMRGPSSSHTAGSYRIGRMAAALLGEKPVFAAFVFDPDGSYAQTYVQQAADRAFTAGLMGWEITDKRFHQSLNVAEEQGLDITFQVSSLKNPGHPNSVLVRIKGLNGKTLSLEAESTGGGEIFISRLNGWPVKLDGKAQEILVECDRASADQILRTLRTDKPEQEPGLQVKARKALLSGRFPALKDPGFRKRLNDRPGVENVWISNPLFFPLKGTPLFSSASEMVAEAGKRCLSLGEITALYESDLLGISLEAVKEEVWNRYRIMRASVKAGLKNSRVKMQLLGPSAHELLSREAEGKVAIGGIHTRAAARALAALHISNSMGVVCAAPTGGSAGVLPGVLVTLAEEKGLKKDKIIRSLLAASAIGVTIAAKATFAAEIAGCQVEIGAAGAMATASVIEAFGGTPQQASDAASVSLQNTMGLVCDLVQGLCEIPCHTRNAVAASSAFVCADMIMGGYHNPISLDDTVDASRKTGQMLPRELKVTSLGGIAVTHSAKSIKRKKP